MTISNHKATIGRKIWVWMNSLDGVKSPEQALDGTVVHVNSDGSVDVSVRTHTGAALYLEALEVHDPGDNNHNLLMDSPYATWMPYQKQQMDATQKA